MITHHLTFAKEADYIIALDDGKVQAHGTFDDLQKKKDIDLLNVFMNENEQDDQEDASLTLKKQASRKSKTSAHEENMEYIEDDQDGENDTTTVTWETYK